MSEPNKGNSLDSSAFYYRERNWSIFNWRLFSLSDQEIADDRSKYISLISLGISASSIWCGSAFLACIITGIMYVLFKGGHVEISHASLIDLTSNIQAFIGCEDSSNAIGANTNDPDTLHIRLLNTFSIYATNLLLLSIFLPRFIAAFLAFLRVPAITHIVGQRSPDEIPKVPLASSFGGNMHFLGRRHWFNMLYALVSSVICFFCLSFEVQQACTKLMYGEPLWGSFDWVLAAFLGASVPIAIVACGATGAGLLIGYIRHAYLLAASKFQESA